MNACQTKRWVVWANASSGIAHVPEKVAHFIGKNGDKSLAKQINCIIVSQIKNNSKNI